MIRRYASRRYERSSAVAWCSVEGWRRARSYAGMALFASALQAQALAQSSSPHEDANGPRTCLASGQQEKLEGSVSVDGGIRLTEPTLRGTGALSREEWSGLIGGISNQMSWLQADQANKVRECLAPACEAIFRQLLGQ